MRISWVEFLLDSFISLCSCTDPFYIAALILFMWSDAPLPFFVWSNHLSQLITVKPCET